MNINSLAKFNAFYLATVPILGIYLIAGIPFYWIYTALTVIVNIINYSSEYGINQRKDEGKWFISIIVISLFGYVVNYDSFFDASLFYHNILSVILFFSAVFFTTTRVDVECFKKCVVFFGILASLICIFQRVQLILTGSFYVDFFIPGLEIERNIESFTTDRVSALFLEPAHLAIYLLPIYYILLSEKRKLLFIVVAIAILFSGSTTGFVLMGVLSLMYMVEERVNVKYIVLFLILLSSSIVLLLVYVPDVLLNNVEKLSSTSSDSLRMLGPLQYLALFDIGQFIFGVGLNQFDLFLKANGVYLVTEYGLDVNANYANAILYSMISYGVVGFVYTLSYLKKKYIKCIGARWTFVYCTGIMLSDQVLFNRNLLYILTFVLLSCMLNSSSNNNNNVIK